jgi:phage/plasmid-associated DNA primase
LSALINDQFEAINIEGKKLIIIGDTDSYVKDIGPLKALTGGDPVRGRVMYSNVTRDVVLKGTMIFTGNHLLNVRDDSGAFMRRCCPYKMSKAPDSKLDMLSRDHKGGWKGVLEPELPGILGRVVLTPHEDVVKYVGNFHQVEALRDGIEETADVMNPLRLYVQEALQKGEGAFLGLKPKGEKETRDFASRLMLYPTYLNFQYKRGLSLNVSHKTFTTLLMSACEELGIKVEKVRKPSGIYIEGIMVRPNYYNPDLAAEALWTKYSKEID